MIEHTPVHISSNTPTGQKQQSAASHDSASSFLQGLFARFIGPSRVSSSLFIGYMLLSGIETTLLSSGFWPSSSQFIAIVVAFSAASFVVLASIAAASRRLGALVSRSRAYGVVSFALSLGLSALAVCSLMPQAAFVCAAEIASLVIAASALAWLSLAWFTLYARLSMARVLACLVVAFAGSAAISFFLVILQPKWAVDVCMAVCALASARSFKIAQAAPEIAIEKGAAKGQAASVPFKPILLSCVIALVTTFTQVVDSRSDASAAWIVGGMLVGVAALTVCAGWRANFKNVQRLALAFTVASILCVPFAWTGVAGLGTGASMAAYVLFMVFAETLLCGIAYRYAVDPCWILGLGLAVIALGHMLGEAAAYGIAALSPSFEQIVGLSSTAAVAVLVLFLFLFTEDDVLGAWGMRLIGQAPEARKNASGAFGAGEGAQDVFSPPDCSLAGSFMQTRTFELTYRHGFTRREEEVCMLLAQGYVTADIARMLCVSNSTAKSHVAHIYKKMDVHSIQEFKSAFFDR